MTIQDSKFFSKPAINTNFSAEMCLSEGLRLVSKHGFGAVMLNMNCDDNQPSMTEQALLCKKYGLEICCAHLPFDIHQHTINANKIWFDETQYFDYIVNSIEFCGKFDIPIAVFHLFSGAQVPPPNDIGFERIEKLLQVAKKNGVVIALENKRNTPHVEQTFDVIDSQHLAFCYDTGHENIFQPNMHITKCLTKKYPLVMIHLHDNDGKSDQHMLPFDGTVDFQQVKQNLIEQRYQNHLMLECRKELSSTYNHLTVEQFVECAYQRAIDFGNLFKS